jgi:hypothetical protein
MSSFTNSTNIRTQITKHNKYDTYETNTNEKKIIIT